MIEFLTNLNIPYNNLSYYELAMIHPSYRNEHREINDDNQRLEFLGDSVVSLIITGYLFQNFNYDEGKMTKLRASYVCESSLSYYAKKIGLENFIKLGNSNNVISSAVIADAFEAFIAAIYLDLGIDAVETFCNAYVIPCILNNEVENIDYKSRLQELIQVDKRTIEYVVVKTSGKQHQPIFEVNVVMNDIVLGSGTGSSKKIAEQMAAKSALLKMAR